MTERPLGTVTTSTVDEPAPAAHEAAGAGSSPSSVPTPLVNDVLRAIACALLVAGSVGSPGSAALLAPFVPALVAIRLLRQRAGSRRFLAIATGMSAVTATSAAGSYDASIARLVAVVVAVLLVAALGHVHVLAARRDPIDSPVQPAWPEPRLRTGLTPTIGAWAVALALVAAIVLPAVDSVRAVERDLVRDGYSLYTRECRDGGTLASQDAFCEDILAQRDSSVELVDEHGPELLAAFLAIFAFGAGATAHLVVLSRARRSSDRIRPAWRLRELEVHWIAAYLVAAGLMAWMATTGDGAAATWLRALGIGVGLLGALLIVSQGVGLAAWLLTRSTRTPGWYRVFVVAASLFVLPVTVLVLFGIGVLDMAVHPRRRALASGNVPGRGSGS